MTDEEIEKYKKKFKIHRAISFFSELNAGELSIIDFEAGLDSFAERNDLRRSEVRVSAEEDEGARSLCLNGTRFKNKEELVEEIHLCLAREVEREKYKKKELLSLEKKEREELARLKLKYEK